MPVFTDLTNQIPEKYRQFSQELRVASATGGTFEYIAGLYFQDDHTHFIGEDNVAFLDFLGAVVPPLAPYLPPAVDASPAVMTGFDQHERIYSGFGSLTWNATDRLRANAGLRAT